MRITPRQQAAIIDATREIFGEQSSVRLFGSRADDNKQGGDIDLYVQVQGIDPLLQEKSRKLAARISIKIGEILPVDIVVQDDATLLERIHQEGMQGVKL